MNNHLRDYSSSNSKNYDRCYACVFYSFLSTDYCKNYDCKHHYEDSCLLGVDPTKCGASGVFEYDKYDIGGDTE